MGQKNTKLAASLLLTLVSSLVIGCSDDKKKEPKPDNLTRSADLALGRLTPTVIYGDDDRMDIYQVTDPKLLDMARSTVGLVHVQQLKSNADGSVDIEQSSYAEDYGLCSSEPYYEQMTAPFCSGFLVGDNVVVTAGHCIDESECSGTAFIFDYAVTRRGDIGPSKLPADNVYTCKEVVHSQQDDSDFAVVILDRNVSGRKPVTLRQSGAATVGTPLTVIGHPAGLPTKVAGGASVRSVRSTYLVANLDTYGGNSGSAVFNSTTGNVEGILVRGEDDYVARGSCSVSNRCTNQSCRGEDVTKISEVLEYLQ